MEIIDGKNLSDLCIQIAQNDDQTRYSWGVYGPQGFIYGLALIER